MTKDYDEILLLSDSKFIKQKEYWAGKLAGDFDNTLFLAHPGGPQPQTETAAAAIPFPGELCAPLMKLSKGSDLSLYMILLTALKWLIRQYTGSPEVVVISPVYIQNISEDTINDLLFVRDAVHGGKPFVQLLLDIRRSVLEAYENQDYPSDELINYLFHDLQERSGSNISISNVVCLLKNIHDDRAVEKELQDKLVFSFEREEDRITGTIFYNPHVYETVYLENVSGQFIHLLTNAVPDVRQEISDIDFLTGEERKQLLFEFNGSAAPYGKDETIHALFEQQAEKTPDHIALVREEEGSPWLMSVSYRELNNRANRLARVLREKGVLPDTVVPIMAEDADLMVIGMMAILKAGGAYLPLNPDYPGERKKMMLLDSAAPILVMQSTLDGGFAGDHAAAIHLDDESIYTGGVSNPAPVNTPRDLMYVMYTSGTTGKPKGVGLSHRNACNVLTWFGKRYNLRPHTHVLQLTDYFFDPSVEDIFGTLIHGGTLYTGPRDLVADRELFSQFVRRNRVYLVNYVPTMLKELLSGGPPLESLQVVIAGGERLEDGVKDQLSSKGYNLYNNYGPTEITVDALSLKCDEKKVTLGRPAANTRCYILNRDNKLAPVGGVGELYIAGDGVARGYLNNPELTAEKFIENPLVPGERVYRTGDLARWTGDGNIEYLGRADRQVKIRGYRVEPGEIETRLLNHDNVKEAVVTAKEGKSGDTYLCAYLVPTETAVPDVPRLRDYLSRTLPDHMIPSYFVTLEKIPLTANGKIDGKALPEPEIAVSGRRIAPTGKVEEKLAEIWSGILDIDYDLIGIDNNFFELGGHSLKATVLTAKIHKEFDVRVPLEEVFHTPTIRELAQYVADRSTSGTGEETFTAIEAAENRSFYPLTSAQKGLYVQQQKEKESTTYNILQVEALDIDADLAGIERTIRELIERHESLRTSFFEYRLKPVQKIHDHVDFNAEYYDLNKEKNRIPDDIVKDFVRPFDLSLPPLMRAGFIKTQEGKHLLIMDMHHIITDGVSFGIFYRDFLRLYRGEQLPPLRLQYRDYSAWQNRRGEQAAYWLNVFKGKIPVLSMPTDYKRPEVKSFEGDHFYFEIKEPLKGALNRSAKEHEATLFMLLLAAYYVLLSKYSNQEDIVVGSPVTGRRHEDLQEIIGMFVNMLALRNKPRAEKTFTEFLREVKQGVLAAMENQDYHFEELVPALGIKGNISRNPLFDAAFALQNMDVGEIEAFDGIVDRQNSAVTPGKYEPGVSRFDLVITAVEGTDSIKMSLEYSTALFKPTTAENLVNHYLEILEQVAENPGSKLEDIKVSYQLAPIENTDLRDHEADFGF